MNAGYSAIIPAGDDRLKTLRRVLILVLLAIALGLGVFAILGMQKANILLEWTTANEVNIAGYNLYRGTSANGPFERINAALLASTSTDTYSGSQYRYTDQAAPGVTYYYELEAVENNGTSSRHGPISVTGTPGGQVEGLIALGLGLAAATLYFLWIPKNAAG